jgi:hypothetical protein
MEKAGRLSKNLVESENSTLLYVALPASVNLDDPKGDFKLYGANEWYADHHTITCVMSVDDRGSTARAEATSCQPLLQIQRCHRRLRVRPLHCFRFGAGLSPHTEAQIEKLDTNEFRDIYRTHENL